MANNLYSGQRMRAKPIAIAGTVASATTKVDLGAAYADVNAAVNMRNMHDPTLYLGEIANVENAAVKAFLSPEETQPAATTNLYQLVDAAGAEIEVTIVKNTTQVYSITGAAAKWLFLQGKGAVGADADLRAFLLGNFAQGGDGSRLKPMKIPIISTATALTATPTLTGSVVNIRGLGHLTLFVYNSDAAVNAVVTPYVSFGNTAPTELANMYSLDVVAGTAKAFTTLATERAAHPLLGISGDWLALACSGNGADIIASAFGTLSGHGY